MNKELSFPFVEGAVQKGHIYYTCHIYVLVHFVGSYMVGLAIVVLVFGYTLSIFRMKYHGYPYR